MIVRRDSFRNVCRVCNYIYIGICKRGIILKSREISGREWIILERRNLSRLSTILALRVLFFVREKFYLFFLDSRKKDKLHPKILIKFSRCRSCIGSMVSINAESNWQFIYHIFNRIASRIETVIRLLWIIFKYDTQFSRVKKFYLSSLNFPSFANKWFSFTNILFSDIPIFN